MRIFQLLKSYSKLPKDYANLPERYVKRVMDQGLIEFKTPKGPQYQRREIKKRKLYYDMNRPWTDQFIQKNTTDKVTPKIYVEPLLEWNYFRGDRVEILVGKDKGKQGIVNFMVKERNWVTVEGMNCDYKYLGKTPDFPGTMYKDELPLLVTTEVSLVDPSDLKATDIEWRYTEEGEKVRVSVRTGRIIPIPKAAYETMDYKEKKYYSDKPKDTKAADVESITFEPKLMTFEQEIMNEMGIVEHGTPGKTYWY